MISRRLLWILVKRLGAVALRLVTVGLLLGEGERWRGGMVRWLARGVVQL